MTDFIQEAVEQTLADHSDVVEQWCAGKPKSWGYLAGRAVGNARRAAGRDLTETERRQVWAALWTRLGELR